MREAVTALRIAPAVPAQVAPMLALCRGAAARPDCPWDEWYPDEATLAADQAQGRLFCAWGPAGELMGGYALTFDPETDALPCWDRTLEPAGEVARLVVAPAWENQGLGRRLLADAMARLAAQGCRSCRILVGRGNVRALRAYAGLGFRRAGEARLYEMDFDCFEKELF